MCLSVKKNKLASFCKIFNFTMKKTAKEDIIVYKGLFPRNCDFKNLSSESKKLIFNLVTPYQDMNVEIGKTYKSEFSIDNCKYTINIEKGIHSFKEIDPCKKIASIVVKCRIPKGSKYYVGNFIGDKSYASDTLEYLEII